MSENAIHLDDLDPRRNQKRARRREILSRFGGHCFFCWGQFEHLTIDHLKPRAKGGSNYFANLQPACPQCNNSKSDRDALEWYRQQSFYSADGEARIREWLG